MLSQGLFIKSFFFKDINFFLKTRAKRSITAKMISKKYAFKSSRPIASMENDDDDEDENSVSEMTTEVKQ